MDSTIRATEGTMMKTTTTEAGVRYILARAAADGRVMGLLREIRRYTGFGNVVMAEQAMTTLDDIIGRRGAYTNANVHEAARRVEG